jgi:hypothetical protein
MIEYKLLNKTKNATVAELKFFHQLNNPFVFNFGFLMISQKEFENLFCTVTLFG